MSAGLGVTRAAESDVTRWSIDGGGIMHSTGGDLELSGTIGQSDAGTMSGRDLELTGGFWFPLDRGDCNSDGEVNLFDYGDWALCFSGPDGRLPAGCACFDLDFDNDVDLLDLAEFQTSFNGS
jgi:hypothetical protein